MFVYFAELDSENIVQRIALMDSKDILDDETDILSEKIGERLCQKAYESTNTWKRTFKVTDERGKFAMVGGSYIPDSDIFVDAKPHQSWVLDSGEWIPPLSKPTLTSEQESQGYFYIWNEDDYQADNTSGWTLYKQPNP
tara:strand:- start:51 stop:467 length:417 start_codon:yes stop_codon:yes gene_type:complete